MAIPSAWTVTPDRVGLQVGQDGVLSTGAATASATAVPVCDLNAYATGELIGGKLTLTGAARVSGGSGSIETLTLVDQAKQALACDIVFFEADPSATTFTDQAAFDPADADLLNVCGVVSIVVADYASFNDNCVATKANIGIAFGPLSTGTSIYAAIVARGAHDFAAATDLQLKVKFLQD